MKEFFNSVFCTVILFICCAFPVSSQTTYPDVVLNSHADVVAYVAGATGVKETVGNLTVMGTDITQADVNSLADRIGTVDGTVRWEGLTAGTRRDDGVSVSDCEGFFKNVTTNGGIILKDCPYLTWMNGISGKTKINGDFIIDNIYGSWPGVDWPSTVMFGSFEEVTGDFRIKNNKNNPAKLNPSSFTKLKKVGGTFEITFANPWTYEFTAPLLTYIGGDILFQGPEGGKVGSDNMQLYSLASLLNLEYVGGSVKIVNFPRLELGGSGDNHNKPGYCFVRYLIDEEVIDYCKGVTLGWEDEPVDLAALGGCSNGYTMDAVPAPLPSCENSVGNVAFEATVKTYPNPMTGNVLYVESKTGLSKIEVFNVTGGLLLTLSDINDTKASFNTSDLQNGYYILKVTRADNHIENLKVLK